MRRLRNDLPYTFRPPRPKAWFRPLALWANRRFHLERKYHISAIHESGFDEVRALVEKGDAVLLAPNHADHADPHLMMEIGSRNRMPLHFMGAREIFEVDAKAAWALQSMGAPSPSSFFFPVCHTILTSARLSFLPPLPLLSPPLAPRIPSPSQLPA